MKIGLDLLLSPQELARSLEIPDLTDSRQGVHAINLVLDFITEKLNHASGWPTPQIYRQSPVVSIEDNFDRLYFPSDNLSRSPVYARYVSETHLLRTHTSVAIPSLLRTIRDEDDHLFICPGMCYRRDVTDRTHCGEPHQVDIWRVHRGSPKMGRDELIELVEFVIEATVPGTKYRANETEHPYTVRGLEVEIETNGGWLELLECGEINPALFEDAGLSAQDYSGLAMGIGLDRLVMVIKGIDDIRLLRSSNPRIRRQMTDLEPYIPVSKFPPIRHDISVAVDNRMQMEDVCEKIRVALGDDVGTLEEVELHSSTPYEELPAPAIERLGMQSGQKNLLLRLIFRSHERSLVQAEANALRDRAYRALHQGTKLTLAGP